MRKRGQIPFPPSEWRLNYILTSPIMYIVNEGYIRRRQVRTPDFTIENHSERRCKNSIILAQGPESRDYVLANKRCCAEDNLCSAREISQRRTKWFFVSCFGPVIPPHVVLDFLDICGSSIYIIVGFAS